MLINNNNLINNLPKTIYHLGLKNSNYTLSGCSKFKLNNKILSIFNFVHKFCPIRINDINKNYETCNLYCKSGSGPIIYKNIMVL
jgi:hypothetical protein